MRLPSLTGSGVRGKALPVLAGVAVLAAIGVASYAFGWLPESLARKVSQLKLGAMDGGNTAASVAAVPSAGEGVAVTGVETGAGPSPAAAAGTAPGEAPSTVPNAAITALPPVTATPPAATSVNPSPVSVVPAVAPTREAAAADSTGAVNPLVLNVRDDSWVEIKRADNTPVVGRIIKGGSVETFDVSEPVTVTIGNIAGVEASLRGTPLDLSSAANGNVARLRLK